MFETTHSGMLNAAVDLDLTHELLLSPTLRQRRLLYYLRGMEKVGVSIDELKALRETTFAQELSLNVASDSDLAT